MASIFSSLLTDDESGVDALVDLLRLADSVALPDPERIAREAADADTIRQASGRIVSLQEQVQAQADAIDGLRAELKRIAELPVLVPSAEVDKAEVTALEDKLSAEEALHARSKTQLEALRKVDGGRAAQLLQERNARRDAEDRLRAVGGPFKAPDYELEIIGEQRQMRLIPVVDGKLGAAIEQKLVPAPRAYDMVVTHRDINNYPLRARLTPVKVH